ncbi:MAG: hypothetical protein WC686_02925 [Candidatus Shapirobacteria bacterium]|jgi:hypothetical protein
MTHLNREVEAPLCPIFQHASFNEQTIAVKKFCRHFDEVDVGQIIEQPGICGQIDLALNYYDMYLSDEVRPYQNFCLPLTDEAAVYYRSDVYKARHPRAIVLAIKRLFGEDPSDIVIGNPGVILSGGIFPSGVTGMLTPELAYWSPTSPDTPKPQPPYSMSRQEIYRSFLLCGIDPLDELGIDTKITTEIYQSTPYHDFYARRSALLFVPGKDISAEEADVSRHWGRIMSTDNDILADAVLFNSGTSANEAVVRLVGKYDPDLVFHHPFWYYENKSTLEKVFAGHFTENPAAAAAMFVNLEPTNHFNLQTPGSDMDPLVAMRLFLAGSVQDHRLRFLVVDATIDPTFSVQNSLGVALPDNIILIKTVSATKHQDGGRNYFYGAVNIQNQDPMEMADTVAQLKNLRDLYGGELCPRQIPFFPLPSSEWIIRRGQIIKEKNYSMAEQCQGHSDWYLLPYTYHSFVFPPPSIPQSISGYLESLTPSRGEVFIKSVNECNYQAVCRVASSFQERGVQVGDSFGFPFTRLNTQGGESRVGQSTFRFKLPRICPGYTTPAEVLTCLAQEIAVNLSSNRLQFV